MLRVLVSALAVIGLLALATAFAPNGGRAEPAFTRSTSELPPPEHLFYVGAAAAAPRSIPWNCSDWQESPAVADADDARVSMILESLAANRGKSIYCAIDQSDTWTKAETWAAGRDRNERDDTVYFGQSGNFRGFLAAQEGYLTDGESGVTGVSRDLIFEFPREERRRRTIIKRLRLEPSVDHLVFSPWGGRTNDEIDATAIVESRNRFIGGTNPHWDATIPDERYGENSKVDWPSYVQETATARCRALGYPRAVNARLVFNHPDTNADWVASTSPVGLAWPAGSSTTTASGGTEAAAQQAAEQAGTHYALLRTSLSNGYAWARQAFPYSATCQKKIRKRR